MRIAVAAIFVLACDARPDPAATPAAVDAKPTPNLQPQADPKPEAPEAMPKTTLLGEPIAEPEPPAVAAGPAAKGSAVTTQQRETAVFELLAGAAPAARFVRDDIEADAGFDKDMRDRVAPFDPGGSLPRIKQGNTTASGGLDRDVVRRIFRAHLNEVRHCYNLGLVRHFGLQGKVTLKFTIAPDGTTTSPALPASTLRGTAGELVGECLVKSVRRWKFPKPTGPGSVDVVYPLEFLAD